MCCLRVSERNMPFWSRKTCKSMFWKSSRTKLQWMKTKDRGIYASMCYVLSVNFEFHLRSNCIHYILSVFLWWDLNLREFHVKDGSDLGKDGIKRHQEKFLIERIWVDDMWKIEGCNCQDNFQFLIWTAWKIKNVRIRCR
jgi:hypothetical protein